jgi:hypothetical protein
MQRFAARSPSPAPGEKKGKKKDKKDEKKGFSWKNIPRPSQEVLIACGAVLIAVM